MVFIHLEWEAPWLWAARTPSAHHSSSLFPCLIWHKEGRYSWPHSPQVRRLCCGFTKLCIIHVGLFKYTGALQKTGCRTQHMRRTVSKRFHSIRPGNLTLLGGRFVVWSVFQGQMKKSTCKTGRFRGLIKLMFVTWVTGNCWSVDASATAIYL